MSLGGLSYLTINQLMLIVYEHPDTPDLLVPEASIDSET
jgi:hypothetical protein